MASHIRLNQDESGSECEAGMRTPAIIRGASVAISIPFSGLRRMIVVVVKRPFSDRVAMECGAPEQSFQVSLSKF